MKKSKEKVSFALKAKYVRCAIAKENVEVTNQVLDWLFVNYQFFTYQQLRAIIGLPATMFKKLVHHHRLTKSPEKMVETFKTVPMFVWVPLECFEEYSYKNHAEMIGDYLKMRIEVGARALRLLRNQAYQAVHMKSMEDLRHTQVCKLVNKIKKQKEKK